MGEMEMHENPAGTVTDPVCGMQVDPATAAASSKYEGETYYFCAPGCKRRFDMSPESFLDALSPDEPEA